MKNTTGLFLLLAFSFATSALAQESVKPKSTDRIQIEQSDGELIIRVDDQAVATYVYNDPNILRPYFAHVKTLDGIQATRNHPPIKGVDRTDHDTMHPGIWLAFGDLDGVDFWRNKAQVVHQTFVGKPKSEATHASFAEEKRYLRLDGSLVCKERFNCGIHLVEHGFLLTWDSTFHSDDEFYFGDQEEMGLGLRVATPISEKENGRLTDSEGRAGAEAIWSFAANWCNYGGNIGNKNIGMTLFCHPDNFRTSWLHARDYGFVAANPFGRQAMKKGKASKVIVKPGEKLRLRYAIWVHGSPKKKTLDFNGIYSEYRQLSN